MQSCITKMGSSAIRHRKAGLELAIGRLVATPFAVVLTEGRLRAAELKKTNRRYLGVGFRSGNLRYTFTVE